MNAYIRSNDFIKSLEFWTASSLLFVSAGFRIIAILTGDTAGIPVPDISRVGRMPEHFYRAHLLLSLARNVVLYAAFLPICFRILPAFLKEGSVKSACRELLLLIFFAGVCLGAIECGIRQHLFEGSPSTASLFLGQLLTACRLAGLFGIYYLARNAVVRSLEQCGNRDHRAAFMLLSTVVLLMGSFFFLSLTEAPPAKAFVVWFALLVIVRVIPRWRHLRANAQSNASSGRALTKSAA